MNKVNRVNLPCRFDHTYWEDVAGDGGSRMQMFECVCDKELTPEQDERMSNVDKCDSACPGYTPVDVQVCPKHGEYLEECSECMYEFYKETRSN